jgi:transposase-like protein
MKRNNKKITERIVTLLKSDSYTISEVCELVGIAESTYYKWQAENLEFSEAIKKANDDRMQFFAKEAKKSLIKKIQGYTVQEKHTVMVDSKEIGPDGKAKPKIKEQKIVDKHFQPDTAAIIFTLVNADPENWKNRQHAEVTGKDGRDLFTGITDEELETKISDLQKKLN